MTTNKTEQSNKKQIRNFLICAWNGLKKPAGNYTKKMCPQAEWEQDKLAEAVKRMLMSRGLEAVDSETDATLIVLVPRHSDLPYKISDARIFHLMLCGSRKYVLLIDRLGRLSVSPEIWPEWFHCIKDASFDFSNSSKFTQWIKSARLTQKEKSFHSSNYRNLGCKLLAGNKYKFSTLLTMAESDKLSRSGTCLLLSYKLSQFFYGLLRMSCRYDRLEHDMNKKISDVFTSDPEPLRRTNQQKKLLDFCVDLKRALRVPIHEKTKNANGAENNAKLILVIDDRPDLIHNQTKKIQEIFFPDFNIHFWKPSQKKNELSLSDIEKYNSLAKSELVLKKTMPSWPEKNEQNDPISLQKVLSHTRFALVDILFPDDKGKDKPKGIAVIRGLQRLALDLPKKKAAKGAAKEQDAELFDIVALSRADDMDKIQPALQAGARGYVLKSRPLALPGVLGELETSILEPITKLHRNFRSLYNLPNETIKLLQTATISPKLSFHVSTQENKQGKKAKDRKTQIQTLPMANLLTAIPKADLHVHVGSCMSPEFLVVASFVMLIHHRFLDQKEFTEFQDSITGLIKFWSERQEKFEFCKELCLDDEFCTNWSTRILRFDNTKDGITNFARLVRKHFKEQIRSYLRIRNDQEKKTTVTKWYESFRSILHQSLDIPDHLDEQNVLKKMSKKPDVAMFQFAMTHSGPDGKPILHDKDDLLRIFVLFLAAGNKDNTLIVPLSGDAQKVRLWFAQFPNIEFDDWEKLHKYFWEDNAQEHNLSPDRFRKYNWKLRRITNENKIEVNLNRGNADETCLHLQDCPDFENDPISYLLATGTRCTNLRTYLEGCEFSGAEHLRHPYLIHLYAQQTVHRFVTQGVMYAELRAAVSGYEYKDFTFQDSCNCMRQAFQQAQNAVLEKYEVIDDSVSANYNSIWLWESPFVIESLFQNLHFDMAGRQFPVKVSLILTGKRHKPTRQMLREAASATVLHTLPSSDIKTAQKFATEDMDKCRIVGFDLAGQEDDDHAPHLFRSEFEQISKMHIPITVHAGENAPAGFVESAVLDLRARRLGHGLALADDPQLMNRLREDGVCVELCPVSNFQTNQFVPANGKSPGREYPLRSFLKNGNAVCLNTDNPIISYTNMIKECFQASYAYGGDGLSLWELLRILRMGFVHSFLSLPERRAMLELADQILFDLFSDPGVVESLRCMAAVKTDS